MTDRCSSRKLVSAPKLTSEEIVPIWPTKTSPSSSVNPPTSRMARSGTRVLWLMWDRNRGSRPSRLIENSSRDVALWAATALAMPTASAFMARNATSHPWLLMFWTMPKKALLTSRP